MSLLEVVVALVIVGLSVAALFSTVTQGTRFQVAAAAQTSLAAHAQSALDLMIAGAGDPARGEFDGGYEWSGRIVPVGETAGGLVPVLVQVTVRQRDGGAVSLETIRLIPESGVGR